jgi:SAM-dependent methyltransferase
VSSEKNLRALEKRIRRGAVAHYEDAAYYDYTYRRRRDDVRFYGELAARRGGPVLELGAGTGRVTLEIAKRGLDVVGIEGVPAMIARAREKLASVPASTRERVTIRRGDLRKVRLRKKFPLVISPFNVFMHLYTRQDLEQAFETVRAHLAPKGAFVFDVLMPDLVAMTRRPTKLYRGPALTHPETGKRYIYLEAFEYDAPRQVQMVSMIFQDAADIGEMRIVPLSQRQFFPQELEALLHYNGFEIEQQFGDFDQSPLETDSESQIIVARLRR